MNVQVKPTHRRDYNYLIGFIPNHENLNSIQLCQCLYVCELIQPCGSIGVYCTSHWSERSCDLAYKTLSHHEQYVLLAFLNY